MNELILKPNPELTQAGDKAIGVPALAEAIAQRKGQTPRNARRRFSATYLVPSDDGLRPFRIY